MPCPRLFPLANNCLDNYSSPSDKELACFPKNRRRVFNVINDGASKIVFTSHVNFQTSLQDKLAMGKTVKHLASVGRFDEMTSLLSIQRITT